MRQEEIRQQFLDYFRQHGHTIVPSDSLVPRGDKTLLFTNAGMNQFKDIFLGLREVQETRIADSQKCMRVSGKHNDLDDVGRDTYHHTFFEMLGNWSFGDYYKAEAIGFAWKLLTEVWKLPKEKLWATYYHDDGESRQYWEQLTDVTTSQILPFGDKDNFWEMGDTGPCGPCSEIHIDLGPGFCDKGNDPAHRCAVNAGCARYIELWNLVFIQYNRDRQGVLAPLPKKHVDTGMGMERIVSVLEGKTSNYDTDLFRPIIAHVESMTGLAYGQTVQRDISFRVIADHIRALTFLITDGIFPSNEGRGYVLRRLLRRGVRHGQSLGLEKPFLFNLIETVVGIMGNAYPSLREEAAKTVQLVKREEERFHETLHRGLHVLDKMIEENKLRGQEGLTGKDMFLLYDTYGFPPDLTRELLEERSIAIDDAGFEEAMGFQREKGRSGWDGSKADDAGDAVTKLIATLSPTEFVGYDADRTEATVLLLLGDSQARDSLQTGEEGECVLDRTPCYAESGGQVGDKGMMTADGLAVHILDTRKASSGHHVHKVRVEKGTLTKGMRLSVRIDTERRADIRRNHTTTHLLHAALREVLGEHVHQAGSLVSPDHFRFDFTHFDRLEQSVLVQLEDDVNRMIHENVDVETEITAFDNAVREGAMALFDEKYSSTVRMIRIPGISLELCGGTHVHRTGDIGMFRILHEGGIAAGVRRIDAITGRAVLSHMRKIEASMQTTASIVKTTPDRLAERLTQLLETSRDQERELQRVRDALKNNQMERLRASLAVVAGVNLLSGIVEHVDMADLRDIADRLKAETPLSTVVLMGERQGKVNIVTAVSAELTKTVHAGKLAGAIARILGGGGGGRPDFAQAGGNDPTKMENVLRELPVIVEQMATGSAR